MRPRCSSTAARCSARARCQGIQALFGGHALPVLDGDAHRERKHFIMAGFSREAMAWYVPTLHRLTADYFRRWSTQSDEMRWAGELEQLALEGIGETLMSSRPAR